MIIAIYYTSNEYRRKMIRRKINDAGFNIEELSPLVLIVNPTSRDNDIVREIRKILDYYASSYILLKKGTLYLLLKYMFKSRRSKDFMAVKRILEKNIGLRIDRGVWLLPSKYASVLKELLNHNVIVNKYYYLDPIEKRDLDTLADTYMKHIIEYIGDMEIKVRTKLLSSKTIREYLTRVNVLQEKLLDDAMLYTLGKSRVITLLKKLGTFKKELLERL